ncbi:unnamed protein product [Didymodactylos carnosus]|uniref:Reverse transcriptase domain-containing protein n=1 Tax=Didymodactylos carnosus TaxID=1234261 RepID=A0A814Z1K4_9BILA|nr:unnamed protein product [Didymodactylos carnosus]CAF3998736.1 unnamed protein product [Didymodactylos carnosus]
MVTLPKNTTLGTIRRLSLSTYFSTSVPSQTTMQQDNQYQKLKQTAPSNTLIDTLSQHLSANVQQYQHLFNLLQQHCVLFDTFQPRTIKTSIHHVINTSDHPSVNAKPYFKTIEQRKNIQQEIDKMLRNGIIVPSHSPWSSPVILLKKPNGEFRFIVDYRKLNSITKKDSYPQPIVEELLQRPGDHSWFTKLDLKSGYYQIPIQQRDKEKTAFVTQDGLYQFEVLSMGLMNAPPTFQRVMNNITGYKRWDYVLVYLDDILIFSNTFDEHMQHLQEVLNEHQFILNPDKCSLANKQLIS